MTVERHTLLLTVIRIVPASITKPTVAVAVMTLVDEGRIGPADPVDQRPPELAAPVVLREPGCPREGVVPAARPITVEDLLSSRARLRLPRRFHPAGRRLADA